MKNTKTKFLGIIGVATLAIGLIVVNNFLTP